MIGTNFGSERGEAHGASTKLLHPHPYLYLKIIGIAKIFLCAIYFFIICVLFPSYFDNTRARVVFPLFAPAPTMMNHLQE